jgi:hypothetical protein
MNTTLNVSNPVVIGRRRLCTLIAGVAITSAAVSASFVAGLPEAGSNPAKPTVELGDLAARTAAQRDHYIAGIAAATPTELAAAFGNVPLAPVVLPATPQDLPAGYPNGPFGSGAASSDGYVDWVEAASPAELAAAFGNVPVEP